MHKIPGSIFKDGIELFEYITKIGGIPSVEYLTIQVHRELAIKKNPMRDAFPKWLNLSSSNRYSPNKLVKLNRYAGTAIKNGDLNGFDFTIGDVSNGGILIKCNKKLNIGDVIELDFILDKRYILPGVVKNNRCNGYGIEFIKPDINNKFSPLTKHYKNLISLIISKTSN